MSYMQAAQRVVEEELPGERGDRWADATLFATQALRAIGWLDLPHWTDLLWVDK